MKVPKELLPDNLIFLGYRGSVAHNMYIPNTDPNSVDDVDIMGVYLAPPAYYIGLSEGKRTIERMREVDGLLWDCVFYEFRHFIKLLLKGNPNVLSMLWLEKQHILQSSHTWDQLIKHRKAFVGRHVKHSFAGYAASQLARMESYNKKGYMEEKRKALVDKYGYDTKNAAHLLRLLQMCYEFLKTGKLEVFRTDAKTFLEVKTGKWTINKVKFSAEDLFDLVNERYESSKLPEKPNQEMTEHILIATLRKHILAETYNYENIYISN